MTRYNKSMREVLFSIREGYSPKEIKMAIGIANDPRYKGGNYDGAVDAIEKIKKGLSNHKQVAAVLKRLNTGFDPEIAEELELDELKMDDPKLVKAFDKLKRGDTVKLKTSSTINKGTEFVDYVVKAKNTVNKGRVEKITLVTKGNEKAVKKFLYKRDGKVTFAIGDMGASIDDIKEKLGKDADAGDYIDDFMKSDAPQFKGKSDKKKKDMAIAAYLDAKDKNESKVLDNMSQLPKGMERPLKSMQQVKKDADLGGMKITHIVKNKQGNKVVAAVVSDGKKNFVYVNNKGVKEEVEIDEGMKYTHAAVDKKGLVIGFASDEKDAKDMAKRNDGKVVKLKKPMSDKKGDMMVNRPLKEEEPDKPDTAKAVDQMRDDKKKTRIAQLQLQIAKATEMINKLNAQEKPSE